MNKGFTLVELLAVIIVLAIIGLITFPIVKNTIEESRKNAALESAESYLRVAEQYVVKNMDEDSNIISGNIFGNLTVTGISATKGSVTVNSNKQIQLTLLIDGYCFYKAYTDKDFSISSTCNSL